jgi:phage tail sheath protein FI
MTVPISYPGVYITEIPSGSRTIVGVATSITAFVGAASRGPADVPVTIFSFADFERTFGGLSRTSGLGYAVRDFYQNGGGEALIVRLVHMATDKDGKVIEDDETSAAVATLDVDGLKLAAIGPGTWGNALQVEVTYPSATDVHDLAQAQGVADTDLFSLVVRDGAPGGGGLEETFLNVTVVDGPARVDTVLAARWSGARGPCGARTRWPDDYKYVPVRRLALYLEETLYRSTQWVVFEPNDAPAVGPGRRPADQRHQRVRQPERRGGRRRPADRGARPGHAHGRDGRLA